MLSFTLAVPFILPRTFSLEKVIYAYTQLRKAIVHATSKTPPWAKFCCMFHSLIKVKVSHSTAHSKLPNNGILDSKEEFRRHGRARHSL